MTDLASFMHRLAGHLSGGMKQKLGLACTLIGSPRLLLLDEPTVGVDPLSRRELWEIIARLVREQNLTVLLSTSYLDEAERCDHVFVLREGKLLASGRPVEVTNMAAGRTFEAEPGPGQPARNLQARLLGDPEIIDAVPEAGRVHLVEAGPARWRAVQGGRIIARNYGRTGASAVRGRIHGAVAAASRRRSKIAGRGAFRSRWRHLMQPRRSLM